MTEIYHMPSSEVINYKYSKLTKEFVCLSDIVGRIVIPKGFVCDWESVPIIKGTSKIGGLVHDYLCRIDSEPLVDKKTAADVYLEVMAFRGSSWWRRYGKYWTVRVTPGYFHKRKVNWDGLD